MIHFNEHYDFQFCNNSFNKWGSLKQKIFVCVKFWSFTLVMILVAYSELINSINFTSEINVTDTF